MIEIRPGKCSLSGAVLGVGKIYFVRIGVGKCHNKFVKKRCPMHWLPLREAPA